MIEVERLRSALRQNSPDGFLFEKPSAPRPALAYAIWRFLKAWSDDQVLGPDQAVLLRQIAEWSEGPWHIGSCPPELTSHFGKACVALTDVGALRAAPFRPSWLTDDVLPASGIDAAPTLRQVIDLLPAESYASQLGYGAWRSLAQKEAAWLAVSAHPGQTTLIVLPTGMGKSLCFQLLPLFGTGLTVVVVPTVALAIDQYQSAQHVFKNAPGVNPLYFAAQDPEIDPENVVHSILTGKCRIVFTSPEACVSGRLRKVMEETAIDGRLENLVIDEAHLVDTWGAFFRVDFQVLAGLRRRWLEKSNGRLRTVLASATITPSCRAILKDLFPSSSSASDQEFVYQHLRPEMSYFDHRFDSQSERYSAIVECAWRLPRPAIIYTTEVDDAKSLHQRLREEQGFRRIGCFHGDTKPNERRRLLTHWRDDDLDLMVATSAFGLGVDKADIRAVVHACYPEDLNRYYQEVGRGGRDGYSTVCLLLPTPEDYHTASTLTPKLLTEKLIQQRWEALWNSKSPVKEDEYVWELCLTSKRQKYIGVRTWAENVRWNKRLILQLQRAGKLEIKDVRYVTAEEEDSDPAEWVQVQLKSGFSPDSPNVGKSIAEQRDEEIANSRRGLAQIDKYLRTETCISRILRDLYGHNTVRLCGGCRWCRREGRPVGVLPRVEFEVPTRGLAPPDVTVVENCPLPLSERPRPFLNLIQRCVETKGVRRFASAAAKRPALLRLFASAFPYRAEKYRLDDLDYEQPFDLRYDERIVVFHLNEISRRGAQLDRGSEIIHMLGRGLRFQDIRYELPARCTSPRFYPDVEQWLI